MHVLISRLALAALAVCLPSAVFAADIEVKGVRIGMTREELAALGAVENKFKEVSIPGFTVGGASGQYDSAALTLEDDKLVGLTFIFYSAWFDDVAAAVKAKYPKIRCQNEMLQNGFGARFVNTTCVVEDGKARLSIERMFDNESGSLSLFRKRPAGVEAQEARKRKADI